MFFFCSSAQSGHSVLASKTDSNFFVTFRNYCDQSANHIAASQCIEACGRGEDDLLKFKSGIRMRRKVNSSDLWKVVKMVLGVRCAAATVTVIWRVF